MKVNIKKTKVMKVSRKGEGLINLSSIVIIDGERLEQVEAVRYLGCKTQKSQSVSTSKSCP